MRNSCKRWTFPHNRPNSIWGKLTLNGPGRQSSKGINSWQQAACFAPFRPLPRFNSSRGSALLNTRATPPSPGSCHFGFCHVQERAGWQCIQHFPFIFIIDTDCRAHFSSPWQVLYHFVAGNASGFRGDWEVLRRCVRGWTTVGQCCVGLQPLRADGAAAWGWSPTTSAPSLDPTPQHQLRVTATRVFSLHVPPLLLFQYGSAAGQQSPHTCTPSHFSPTQFVGTETCCSRMQ